ncbi:MAG: hypothetical protein ABSE49_29500 [Polyangiaceae bacterium]|jgi:hypothetical protein
MREPALALALAFLASGCDTGTAASPVFASTPSEGEGGAVEAGFAVCPEGMTATFDSIYAQMLSTTSCGSTLNTCHSTAAAKSINGLDYSLDEQGVYLELVGDGGGVLSYNIAGAAKGVLRVDPGDAGASMLYIKLTLDSGTNPLYGSGMPQSAPGSVCPAAISAVATWINSGASLDGGVPLEASAPVDAGTDGDGGAPVDATID